MPENIKGAEVLEYFRCIGAIEGAGKVLAGHGGFPQDGKSRTEARRALERVIVAGGTALDILDRSSQGPKG